MRISQKHEISFCPTADRIIQKDSEGRKKLFITWRIKDIQKSWYDILHHKEYANFTVCLSYDDLIKHKTCNFHFYSFLESRTHPLCLQNFSLTCSLLVAMKNINILLQIQTMDFAPISITTIIYLSGKIEK